MSAEHLTRRSLLVAGAGALAGGLTRPGGAVAALAGAGAPTDASAVGGLHPGLSEHPVGSLGPAGATVGLTRVADLLGVQWEGAAHPLLELRFLDGAGRWSRWVSAAGHGHGPDASSAARERQVGDPVWTGGTTVVQLRSARALHGVRLHLVDVSGGVGARREALAHPLASAAARLPLATPILQAGPGQPPIIARRAWAHGASPPGVPPEYGSVRLAFVHHTENPNGYTAGEVPAMLRAIYLFHRYARGWNDIGYNFVIDLFGRIFEARAGGIEEPVVGAHAGGFNLVSSGVAILGSFMSTPISAPARSALAGLLAWKLSLHGLPAHGRVTVKVNPAGALYSRFPASARVPLERISGHRDGDSTDCPGDVLYGELPGIRRAVHGLAPRPAQLTIALSAAAAPAPAPPTPAPGAPGTPAPTPPPGAPAPTPSPAGATSEGPSSLGGVLRFLDGTAIAGAPIAVQVRAVARRGEAVSESTIAQTSTDGQGRWSVPANAPPGGRPGRAWLRALCPGAGGVGATVSAPLRVDLGAPLSAPGAPPPSAPAAGPPGP